MTEADEATRLALSAELEALRANISDGKLVLFIGEHVSILDALGKATKPTYGDWWDVLDSPEVRESAPFLVAYFNLLFIFFIVLLKFFLYVQYSFFALLIYFLCS